MKQYFPFMLAALASPAIAEGTRELDSHEHGVGELNIAFQDNTLAMEFHAPGTDIVGFEYQAESAEDRAAIEMAVATLARPLDLFIFPASAECTVISASAALESEEEHDDHDDHDDHADEAGHTEFHAEYTLNCGNPNALSEIGFAYFDAFENARELEIQIISAAGAQAFEVERDDPQLDLRGMF